MIKTPEPIILAVVLLMLALLTGWLAYDFPAAAATITDVTKTEPKGGRSTKKLKTEEVQASLAAWTTPANWQEPANHHRLFESDAWLFYPSAYPNPDDIRRKDPKIQSPSGIFLSWDEKYGFDIQDSGVDRADPDGDGFSNIVEYRNEPVGIRYKASECDPAKATNPLDAKSHPSYLARLRLQQYESRPFHIEFRGIEQINGVNEFQIFLRDVDSSKQPGFKKTGDKLGFEDWIVGPYVESIVNEMDPNTHLIRPVNKSTIELDKPEIDLKILVTYRQTVDSPESTADFVMLMPSEVGKTLKVSRGKNLTVPYIPETTFLVLEANDTGAKIRDNKTKQEYHILKLIDSEWDEVPQAPASK